jgi:hypothetical protein
MFARHFDDRSAAVTELSSTVATRACIDYFTKKDTDSFNKHTDSLRTYILNTKNETDTSHGDFGSTLEGIQMCKHQLADNDYRFEGLSHE